MKNVKHSKFKNTGILFEMLVRQMTADTMNNHNSKAIKLIKKHFNLKTELSKELNLYKALNEEKFNSENKADALISAVISSRKQLNESLLRRQKYNLIKDIKVNFNINDFFKSRVSNYKVMAAAYKLFEYAEADNPIVMVKSKVTLAEHIISKKKPVLPLVSEIYSKQGKDLRLLSYKILVDKYNTKYNTLNTRQKNMLREYINNISNTVVLQEYVQKEIPVMQKELKKLNSSVGSKVVMIKLREVINMLTELKTVSIIKDKHILTMLRYYELIKELKNIKGK